MIYRVKEPFSFTDSRGTPRVMSAGDLVTEGHEAYRKAWFHLMEPVQAAADRAVTPSETATAAPGERRSITPPAPKPPVVPADDLEELRKHAEDAGVKVDKRWGAEKLRSEIEAAKTAGKDKE
jgi:hypothetical protein